MIFLNPDVPGEHCGFKGSGECAACLRENCEAAIDACCNDEDCSKESSFTTSIMQTVDVCGEGNDSPKCAYEADKASTSGNEGVVRACLIKSCATKCFGNGRTHTSCDLQSGGQHCSCTKSKESMGPPCTKESVNGTCVLTDMGCKCGDYGCSGGTSCKCSFDGTGGSKTCSRSSSKGTCCLTLGSYGAIQCQCDPDESCRGTGEVSLASCDESEVLRALKGGLVDSCSY